MIRRTLDIIPRDEQYNSKINKLLQRYNIEDTPYIRDFLYHNFLDNDIDGLIEKLVFCLQNEMNKHPLLFYYLCEDNDEKLIRFHKCLMNMMIGCMYAKDKCQIITTPYAQYFNVEDSDEINRKTNIDLIERSLNQSVINKNVMTFSCFDQCIYVWQQKEWYKMTPHISYYAEMMTELFVKIYKYERKLSFTEYKDADNVSLVAVSKTPVSETLLEKWSVLSTQGKILNRRSIKNWGQLWEVHWQRRHRFEIKHDQIWLHYYRHDVLPRNEYHRPTYFKIIQLPFVLDEINSFGLLYFVNQTFLQNIQMFPLIETNYLIIDADDELSNKVIDAIQNEYANTIMITPLGDDCECFTMAELSNMNIFHNYGMKKIGNVYYSIQHLVEHLISSDIDPCLRKPFDRSVIEEVQNIYKTLRECHPIYFQHHLTESEVPKLLYGEKDAEIYYIVKYAGQELVLNSLPNDADVSIVWHEQLIMQHDDDKIINQQHFALSRYDKRFLIQPYFYYVSRKVIKLLNKMK